MLLIQNYTYEMNCYSKNMTKNVKRNALDTNRNIQSSTIQYHQPLKTTAKAVFSTERKLYWDFNL
jgi:hypothetical protein